MIDCKHPPSRYYTGTYWNPVYGDMLWLGCCNCGEILGEKLLNGKTKMDIDMDATLLKEALGL